MTPIRTISDAGPWPNPRSSGPGPTIAAPAAALVVFEMNSRRSTRVSVMASSSVARGQSRALRPVRAGDDRDARIGRGPRAAQRRVARIVAGGHRPPGPGQHVQVVGVVAIRRHEGMVALVDHHEVAVFDL